MVGKDTHVTLLGSLTLAWLSLVLTTFHVYQSFASRRLAQADISMVQTLMNEYADPEAALQTAKEKAKKKKKKQEDFIVDDSTDSDMDIKPKKKTKKTSTPIVT